MFGFLALLFALVVGQDEVPPANPHPNGFVPTSSRPCEKSENKASGLNYFGCNDAGKCTNNGRKCKCCDPYDPGNWCAGGELEDGSQYPHGFVFTGTYCNTLKDYVSVAPLGWRFETDPGETPVLSCNDVLEPHPCPEKSGDCVHSHFLQNQVGFAFKYPCNADCSAVDDSIPSFDAIFLPTGCQTCTPENPCTNAPNQPAATTGVSFGYTVFFNTFYDKGCFTDDLGDPPDCAANTDAGALAHWTFEQARGDLESNDMTATRTLSAILRGTHPKCGTAEDTGICSPFPGFSHADPMVSEPMVYANTMVITQQFNKQIVTESPTEAPTPEPTVPTPDPTAVPTMPADPCFQYTNELMDHQFLGSAANCRAGIDPEWPGGKTCDSPYIICLPAENTDKNPDATEYPNIGQTLPATDYSIMECASECAYDQRCTGFELRPNPGTPRGECMMIDDNEVIMETTASWPAVGADAESAAHVASGLAVVGAEMNGRCCVGDELGTQAGVTEDVCKDNCYNNMKCNFFSYSATIAAGLCTQCKACPTLTSPGVFKSFPVTGRLELGNPPNFDTTGDALCFAKKDYCNPYFEANELNAEMLKCYCPNNRKGTYTKKVKRIVENTKFCDRTDPNVAEIDERIKKAQANRMFHLCENWCLFETNNPMTESWYYNPWLTCWREQYAGVGEHNSYCMRVIREPNTIEQMFINKRAGMFCDKDPTNNDIIEEITQEPTANPVTFVSTWYLAEEEDSCDDACADQGLKCDELTTNSLLPGEVTAIGNALDEASPGTSCSSTEVGPKDWALPAIKTEDGKCLLRNANTEYVGCNWATGVGYKRLCACYSED